MERINVVGTSGSGKSTFSQRLASVLDVPYVEMDALYWRENWTGVSDEDFFETLEDRLQATDGWVLDGNYSRTIPIKWRFADTVIWIDYRFSRTLYQAVKRALWRSWSKTEIWAGTGNRESFAKLFSRNSIVLWTITTYRKRVADYEAIISSGDYPHIEFVRLRSPRESEAFFNRILEC